MKKFIYSLICLSVLAAILLAYWKLSPHWKAEAHVAGMNYGRMQALYLCLKGAAAMETNLLAQSVQRGFTNTALMLPIQIRTNFSFDTRVSDYYRDTWGNPFNVVIAPILVEQTNAAGFNVLIWSSGPNGINETGKGDDISWKWTELDVDVN